MLLALLLALFLQDAGPARPVHVTLRPSGSATEIPAGLRVAVWLSCKGENFARVETRIAANGRTEIDLPLPIGGVGEKDTILAHAELLELGWQHHDQLGVVDRTRASAEIQNFAFLRGGTLLGRVDAGAANSNTKVELYLLREGAPPRAAGQFPSWERVVAPAGRSFRVHFTQAGRYRLLARAEGVGTACIGALELAPDKEPPAPLALQLAGTGVIEGRFVDPEGQPHRNHPVWAVPRALADGEEVRDAEFRCAPLDEGEAGLRWCACETDSNGRFQLSGLAPGNYWLYSGAPHAGGSEQLRGSSIATDTHEVELVGGAPRLELHVLDADGKEAEVRRNRPDVDDPDGGVLLCVRCPRGEQPQPWLDTPKIPSSNPYAPSRVFLVEPGERYVYAYVRDGIAPVEGELTIEENAFRSVRELRAVRAAAAGELELEIARPDGSPLARDFQVNVESPENGLPLYSSERDTTGSTWQRALPPGRYRLRIETEDSVPFCGTGWTPSPAPFGDWTGTIEIRSGEKSKLDVRLWRGGKLRLALALPPGSTAPTRWIAQYPTELSPREAGWLELGARGPGARVSLRPDPAGRPPEHAPGMPEPGGALAFFEPNLHVSYHACALLPGDEETSADWIPPGDYIVRVEAREFAPAEAKVTIRPDETAKLRLELVPR